MIMRVVCSMVASVSRSCLEVSARLAKKKTGGKRRREGSLLTISVCTCVRLDTEGVDW